jgi:hypothetical protein
LSFQRDFMPFIVDQRWIQEKPLGAAKRSGVID